MNARVDLPEAKQVCPTTTRRLLAEGALLVDVREPLEVERVAFDVAAVAAIPLSQFERRGAELPRDRMLVIACDVGERSLKATYYLMYQGYTQVANMEGGLQKWARKGFPVRGDIAQADVRASGACADASGSSCCAPAPKTAGSGCCG